MARPTIIVPFHECTGEPVFREARAYSDFLDENDKPFRDYDRNGQIIVPTDAVYPVHATNVACMTCGARWHKTEFSDGTAEFASREEKNAEPVQRSWLSRMLKPA